jgi:predicted AlkP superfamily phosphohydrolase/phosphomutase
MTGDSYADVDWSRTKAYASGLGRIYLNRRGREPQGMVGDDEAEAVLARIEAALLGLRDGEQPVVASVARGAELHDGTAIPGGTADLYVGFHRGYRVSWQSCLGGTDEPVLFDNTSAWSGDHCSVDPALVPGVLLTTLPLREARARVVDIGPTILDWAGVEFRPPSERDGRSLLAR